MLRHLLRPHPVPSLHYFSNLPAFYIASVCVCVCVTAMTQLWSRDYLGLMVLEEEDMKEEVTDLKQSTAGRELLNAIQHGGREQKRNCGLACEIAFVFSALTSYTDPATKTRLKQPYSLKNVLKKIWNRRVRFIGRKTVVSCHCFFSTKSRRLIASVCADAESLQSFIR